MSGSSRPSVRAAAITFAAVATFAAPADSSAQGWHYPSFQLPVTSRRELNFAVADVGDDPGRTSVVFQLRNTPGRVQVSFDLGLVDRPGVNGASAVVGAGLARSISARSDPIRLLPTIGAYATIGEPRKVIRVPVGISVGGRLPLEGSLLLTPYLHPRLSLDACAGCASTGAGDDVAIGADVELGLDLTFTPALSVRLAAVLGSSAFVLGGGDAFGVSLAYRPAFARRSSAREAAKVAGSW